MTKLRREVPHLEREQALVRAEQFERAMVRRRIVADVACVLAAGLTIVGTMLALALL